MTKGLLLWQSGMAGAQVLSGAAGVAGIVGEKPAGLLALVVGALQAATITYVHGLNSPVPTDEPENGDEP